MSADTLILLKYNTSPGIVPTTGQLVLRELAINTFDGEVYFKKDNGTQSVIRIASSNNLKTINNINLIGTGNITVSLPTKANTILSTSFTGNPKKATVTFSTPFIDANYSIALSAANARTFTIENKTANGFIINTNANTALTGNVDYTATKHGEV
ncbi:MAG: hypothetical protein KDH96_01565 [Candidatus Riesia sp.]|nr:hypothetical protein [Candidatus Riesia sp.]